VPRRHPVRRSYIDPLIIPGDHFPTAMLGGSGFPALRGEVLNIYAQVAWCGIGLAARTGF